MEIVLATKNAGKVDELTAMMKEMDVNISSLIDHPEIPEIEETGATFLENARKKARCVAEFTGKYVLADDSGLEVEALGGLPGVTSARYAGESHDYKANNEKLLREMRSVPEGMRHAKFCCVMVLVAPDGKEWSTTGECLGTITRDLRGAGGFGYDPLFYVTEKNRTMAELAMDEKNEISHRGRALQDMMNILVEILSKSQQT
jgi:XTP/dITP diphosphohydrolase